MAIDVPQGQACYSAELPIATSGALRRDDRGPEDPAVATFTWPPNEYRKMACARILPADAERVIADPGLHYLEFEVAFTEVRGALQPLPADPGNAPDVAEIVCAQDGAVALTPEVRPQSDGIHFRIHNHAAEPAEFYALYDGGNEGGSLPSRVRENVSTFPPGPVSIGCFADERDIPYWDPGDRAFATLTIVDPYELWTEPDLECGEGNRRPAVVTDETLPHPVGVIPDYEALIREFVPGVAEDDVLERPLYPDSEFIFETRTVARDGRRIAQLMLVREDGTWAISPWVCPGSGIAGES